MGLPEDSPTSFEIFVNSVHPEDRKAVQESIEAAIRDNKSQTFSIGGLAGRQRALAVRNRSRLSRQDRAACADGRDRDGYR